MFTERFIESPYENEDFKYLKLNDFLWLYQFDKLRKKRFISPKFDIKLINQINQNKKVLF